MNKLAPFQLLELNVISAQDLEPTCRKKMRTYAVAWVQSGRKLSTRIDTQGHINPTWNDKFIFRVDEDYLNSETAAVMIEIYAVHWLRDIHIGTVRAIIGNLIPHLRSKSNRKQGVSPGTMLVALQVWRPSGRPQGILNIGVSVLDSSRRSLPLIVQDPNPAASTTKINNNDNHTSTKPELRRSKSDTSTMVAADFQPIKTKKGSSIINGGSMVNGGGGSMVNGVEDPGKNNRKVYSRGGSMVNGVGDPGKNNRKAYSRGGSMVNYTIAKINPRKGKASSMVNGFEDTGKKTVKGKSSSVVSGFEDYGRNSVKSGFVTPPRRSPNGKKGGGAKVFTDSELGPSPSEVAAAVARNGHATRFDDAESSILGWSLDDESIEGLRSKLERWRMEAPGAYDASSSLSGASKRSRHTRRHSDSGGTFSCFGNICGCEISITCGGGPAAGKKKVHRAPASYIADPDDVSYI